ncbi:MAG: hypothetical protein IJB26_00285 [Clostridia bacterium]|nr:hypothetical protein [Clostridia bacterium]
MNNEFQIWLEQNGLTEAFTTSAGDALYVNRDKKFGVLRKHGEYGVHSFYLDDIIEFKTYDDENPVAEWSAYHDANWRLYERSTRFSTNEVYVNLRLRNQLVLKIQLFVGTTGNIRRDSYNHVNLYNYACQISHLLYNLANGI